MHWIRDLNFENSKLMSSERLVEEVSDYNLESVTHDAPQWTMVVNREYFVPLNFFPTTCPGRLQGFPLKCLETLPSRNPQFLRLLRPGEKQEGFVRTCGSWLIEQTQLVGEDMV
ncbi:hypothetical protein PoB_002343000 [Plakobranchus ocellatus]|uniref:Uncharacterized protein n=1 Tax=Plakobranchus ocellatus TaxID=259542 RepID=A0AAV3ZQQ6_9GAST|nr:hypothetical protein PoB_002343000 [Plakobranchus ocellatus]